MFDRVEALPPEDATAVLDVTEAELELLARLGELLGAFIKTYQDLPEDERSKPH